MGAPGGGQVRIPQGRIRSSVAVSVVPDKYIVPGREGRALSVACVNSVTAVSYIYKPKLLRFVPVCIVEGEDKRLLLGASYIPTFLT